MDSIASSPPPHATLPSRTLGSTIADKYVLLEEIGTGTMGSVYRARHTALDRDVALKLMAPEVAHDRAFAERFRREAHAASRLTHPNSVMITDFGQEPDGLLYLVMEYVRGPSLEALLERGERMSERRIVDILSQVLSAVAVAHTAGIVHRDLKPANVIVVATTDDDGRPVDVVKVCDFGVAALRDRAELVTTSRYAALRGGETGAQQLTMAGAVVGTPAYMAPEQASGGVQDARTDLYSLGVVLFEMLTGRLPLWGDTLEDTMRRQIDTPAPSPRDFVECTPALAEVCLRALAKNPAERYESARAMRAALRAALAPEERAGMPLSSAPPEASESLAGVAAVHEADEQPAPKRRSGMAWGWMTAAVAAGAVMSITWLSQGRPYEAAAHRLVHRAGAMLPGASAPHATDTASPPERAPLVAPARAVSAAPAVTVAATPADAPARAPAARPARPRVRPTPQHESEPSEELIAAGGSEGSEAAAPTVVDPGAAAAHDSQPESPADDLEKAWATRH